MALEDEFGDVIGKARRGLDLSAGALARQAAIPERRIRDFERYRAQPSDAEVAALAGALGLRPGPLRELASGVWEPAPAAAGGGAWQVRTLQLRHVTGFSSNTHLLWGPDRAAAIVDPGFEPAAIRRAVADLGLLPRVVAVTHGHLDHVGHARELAEAYRVPALIGAEDLALVGRSDRKAFTPAGDARTVDLGAGGLLGVMAAPGHTAGGRCYLVPGACFVGDTLFAASIGRTFGGPPDYPVHLATVRERILALPPDTRLYPGHGPATTVAEERSHNPFA